MSAAVQGKKWKGNVGAPVVTQLRGSLQVHQHGIIITTSDFSKAARAEANAPGKAHIGLINGAELVELLIKHQVGVTNCRLDVIALDEKYWGEFAGASQYKIEAEVNPAKTEPGAQAQQTLHEGLPAEKQITFTLFGQQHTAALWRDVLVDVCAALTAQHGPAFAGAAFTVKGRTRQYVTPSPDGMIAPAKIPGTGLWVEANQSAKSVVQVIGKLLVALGHQAGDFAWSCPRMLTTS